MSKNKPPGHDALESVEVPPQIYTAYENKIALENAIYNLTKQQVFYGSLLQMLNIKYVQNIPTAAIWFNPKASQFEVLINPGFFHSLTNEGRVAVFHHEMLHFTNKHLFRAPFMDKNTSDNDKRLFNIAGDMAINQYINDLPEGCVDVKQWKLDNGDLFPILKNMEAYYELIKKEAKKQQKAEKEKKDGKGTGTKGNVNDMLKKFKKFDEHFFDDLDEETKKKMLDETKKVLKRTIEKSQHGHSTCPDSIKDLLNEIDQLTASINYKQILKNTIKKTVSAAERVHTWRRPNSRYGMFSPGKKMGDLPNLNFYIDTSGSISHAELNKFLKIMSDFLKVGVRNCNLCLWHTDLYYKKKYKLGKEVDPSIIEAGGTDVLPALMDVQKTNPNLSIFLTDGYFDKHNIKLNNEVIWIISEGGQADHPMSHLGKTIPLDKIK